MVDIVLKDASGSDITYENVGKLKLLTPDGNFQSFIKDDGGLGVLPKLYVPSSYAHVEIYSNQVAVKIYNNSRNGLFSRHAEVVLKDENTDEEIVVGSLTFSTTSISSHGYLFGSGFRETFYRKIVRTRLSGENFIPSDISEGGGYATEILSVGRIIWDIPNAVINDSGYFFGYTNNSNISLTNKELTILPVDGYYLPKRVDIVDVVDFNGESVDVPAYSYDQKKGIISIEPSEVESIYIRANVESTPWLMNPIFTFDTETALLTLQYADENADTTNIFFNDELIASCVDNSTGIMSITPIMSVDASGTERFKETTPYNYKFTHKYDNSYYYSRVRLDFVLDRETTVTINLQRHCEMSSSAEFYIEMSKLDTRLTYNGGNINSYPSDSSTVLKRLSANGEINVDVTIPEGTHFIVLKAGCKKNYGDSRTSNSWVSFSVNPVPVAKTTVTVEEFLIDNYGPTLLQAQSIAEGYQSSELVDIYTLGKYPNIDITDDILTIANEIPTIVSAFEIYADNELIDTVAYDSTTGFSVDMTSYEWDFEGEHSIYVVGIGEGVAKNESNIAIFDNLKPTYSVESVSGASYGFVQSGDYYVSQNKGVPSSYAICKVLLNCPVDCTATFNCINYAESNYDFGILSTLDHTLTLSYSVDSSNVYKSFKGSNSSSVQSVNYTVPAGEHFVYVKFRKDGSVNSGNDTLQFNVTFNK